jgi:hypothetical protein
VRIILKLTLETWTGVNYLRILSCGQELYIKPADYKAGQFLVSLAVLRTSFLTNYSNGCKNTRCFFFVHKIVSRHIKILNTQISAFRILQRNASILHGTQWDDCCHAAVLLWCDESFGGNKYLLVTMNSSFAFHPYVFVRTHKKINENRHMKGFNTAEIPTIGVFC